MSNYINIKDKSTEATGSMTGIASSTPQKVFMVPQLSPATGALALALFISSFQATGTAPNALNYSATPNISKNTQSAAAQDISYIRDILKLSVTEMSRVFGVSRQAIYDWVNGGSLSEANVARLRTLTGVAQTFNQANVEVNASMLRRPVNGQMSILEAVKADVDSQPLVLALLDTIIREAQQRQLLAARLAKRQSVKLSPEHFGEPTLDERG